MKTALAAKRKYPRHSLPHGIPVTWNARGGSIPCTAGAVGLGGLFLHTPDALPVGAVMEMDLDLKGRKLHVRAKVRDSVPGKGMGLQFTQLDTPGRRLLNQFLSREASPSGKAESESPYQNTQKTDQKTADKTQLKEAQPRSRATVKKFAGKQRSVRRCAFVASAEVVEPESNTRLSARISELAVGGCYIDALNPFPQGTNVEIRILRDNGVFETKARVVYCHPDCGMGLAFVATRPDQRSILEDWLAEIITRPVPVS